MECLKSEWEYKVKYGKSKPRITVQIPIDKNRTKEILVGTISEDDCPSPVCCCKEEHAIAKLISAAPDLLEALNDMIEMYEQVQPVGGWQGVYDSAIYAIKKATE